MARSSIAIVLALLLASCGPDKRQCTRSQVSFSVVLELPGQQLPEDTLVRVMYGGSSVEEYRLDERGVHHEVVFCGPADANGMRLDVPDSGFVGPADAVACDLWTGGYTSVQVLVAGVAPTEYPLLPQEDGCTVSRTIELDTADGG